MAAAPSRPSGLSGLTAGLGLKAQHYDAALACAASGLWFEVHAENYTVAGGPRLAWLDAIRAAHPVSIHGVALSLGGSAGPDRAALAAFAALVARVQPALVSEHLAWSRLGAAAFPDLLPCPRSHEALAYIAANIGRVQDAIGRPIAIENPTHYITLEGHDWSEVEFLDELARRSGCDLLLDINNVHVASHNLGTDPVAYLEAFPAARVTEIHLAGHRPDAAPGSALLIDSHDAAVDDAVWRLYTHFIERAGPRPTLIERDADLPPFETLMAERDRAAATLLGCEALA